MDTFTTKCICYTRYTFCCKRNRKTQEKQQPTASFGDKQKHLKPSKQSVKDAQGNRHRF